MAAALLEVLVGFQLAPVPWCQHARGKGWLGTCEISTPRHSPALLDDYCRLAFGIRAGATALFAECRWGKGIGF